MVPGQLLEPHRSHLLSKQEDAVTGRRDHLPRRLIRFYIFNCSFLMREETRKIYSVSWV